ISFSRRSRTLSCSFSRRSTAPLESVASFSCLRALARSAFRRVFSDSREASRPSIFSILRSRVSKTLVLSIRSSLGRTEPYPKTGDQLGAGPADLGVELTVQGFCVTAWQNRGLAARQHRASIPALRKGGCHGYWRSGFRQCSRRHQHRPIPG